jgi:hypothetical protein
MGRKMSCYERPKVFGEKCLGHGISPYRNTDVILAAKTTAVYFRYRPEAAVQRLDAMLYLHVIWRTSSLGILLVEDSRT